MGTVTIVCVFSLYACPSLRSGLRSLLSSREALPPSVGASAPLKQQPPAGLLSPLTTNPQRCWGGGSGLWIGCPAPRPYRDPGSCPAASVLIPPPPTDREQT